MVPEMPPLLEQLLTGRRDVVWRQPDGEFVESPPQPPAGLLSGAFNPLHVGHEELRDVAEELLNGPVVYELPIANADKPTLEPDEVHSRVAQFERHPVALTNAATFAEKARLFPGVTFVVGYDTAERILQPRFYGNSETVMREALAAIRDAGSRFLVAGRVMEEEFRIVKNLRIPLDFHAIFIEVSQRVFRRDISSTDIRQQRSRE